MGSSSYRESLITVAKLYYLGNMSQYDIAKLMKLSRPKISRMLKTARDMKIVQFAITTPPSHFKSLQTILMKQFPDTNIVVIPSSSSLEITKKDVGKTLAEYFSSIVKDNDIIGIAWGSTISGMLRYMPQLHTTGVSVWQLCAGLPVHVLELDGHEIVKRLAKSLNAEYHVLNVPFVVSSALLKKLLLQEPEIAHHFSMFKQMDIAIVGLGSSIPESSTTYLSNYITLEESASLVELGCAADICGHRLYTDARPADDFLSCRTISIDLDTLKQIPQVIAAACGEDKTISIIAALKGNYINSLIIDEVAAISVIKTLGL